MGVTKLESEEQRRKLATLIAKISQKGGGRLTFEGASAASGRNPATILHDIEQWNSGRGMSDPQRIKLRNCMTAFVIPGGLKYFEIVPYAPPEPSPTVRHVKKLPRRVVSKF